MPNSTPRWCRFSAQLRLDPRFHEPARRVSLPVLAVVALTIAVAFPVSIWASASVANEAVADHPAAPRIVSLNPSLTAILVALGAGGALVGIDESSAEIEPSLAHLPLVGGLYSPSLEGVVALDPDRVVLVPSVEQRDFRRRLDDLGIEVSIFENITFEQIMENVERLGALVQRDAAAASRISEVRETWRRVGGLTERHDAPTTLVVLQHDPLFVIGSGSYIDEMIRAAGAINLASEFAEPYPRVAVEWVVASAPAVIVDMAFERDEAQAYWSRWPGIPAVANDRVVALEPGVVSLPGPYLDRSVVALARAIHGESLVLEPGAAPSPGATPDAGANSEQTAGRSRESVAEPPVERSDP